MDLLIILLILLLIILFYKKNNESFFYYVNSDSQEVLTESQEVVMKELQDSIQGLLLEVIEGSSHNSKEVLNNSQEVLNDISEINYFPDENNISGEQYISTFKYDKEINNINPYDLMDTFSIY